MHAAVEGTYKYVPAFHPFGESGTSSGNSKYPLKALKENLIQITEIY